MWYFILGTAIGAIGMWLYVMWEASRQSNDDSLPANWRYFIDQGWVIWATSCSDGCNYAWFKPRPSGAYECYGCVCHMPLPKVGEDL